MALYHTAQGSVNYTVQGTSVTVLDGIASNFATDSYLQLESAFSRSTTSWELNICATPGTGYGILMGSRSAADWRIQFTAINFTINVGNGNITKTFDSSLDLNTFYNVKIVRSNNDVSVYIDDVLMASNSAEFTGTGNQVTELGNGFYNWQNQYPYDGKIDLNKTYISSNGQPWFGTCPVEVKKHQIMGPVGYTIQGSATVTDGIATNFAYGSRLLFSQNTDYSSADEWEFYFRVYVPDSFEQRSKGIINRGRDPNSGLPSSILSFYSFNFVVNPQSTGTPLYLGPATRSTWYRVKMHIKDGATNCYWYADDGTLIDQKSGEWTFDFANTQFNIGETVLNMTTPSLQIDLNQSYVKKNGSLWFYQPQETKYIIRENPTTQEQHLVYAKPNMYLAGPVNYTLQGTTTVTDGIATPFNYYNRVVVSQSTTYSSNSNCEFYTRFKAPSTFEAEVKCIFSFGTNPNNGLPNAIISNYGGALIFSDGGGGVYLENLSTDTWYRVKAILQNGSYDVTHYADDGTVLKHLTGTLGAFDLGTSNFEIGRTNQTGAATYSFEIDLNNTYIVKDGSLWFYGKNYSSKNIAPVPSGFTYGTTTTSAIGFVDMRSQAFTAAPAGTGYNEVPSRTIEFATSTLDKINAYAYSFQLNGVGVSEGTTGSVKLKSITLYPPDNFPDTLVYETVYMNIFERTLNSANAYTYTGSSSNATRLYDPSLTATWNFADLGLSSTKDYIVLFSKTAPSSAFESVDYIRAVIYKHDTTDVQNMGTRFGNAGGVYSSENPPTMNGIWSPKMTMVIAGE